VKNETPISTYIKAHDYNRHRWHTRRRIKCELCRFYVPIWNGRLEGKCHVNPPVIDESFDNARSDAGLGNWPKVTPEDWCGSWLPEADPPHYKSEV